MPDSTIAELMADQERRWNRGERVTVESYLERQPSLREGRDDLMELIYAEVVLRETEGEQPTLAEYQLRFPTIRDDLRRQFEVHAVMGIAGPSKKAKRLPKIPGYTVLKRIGAGGMGVVYQARQKKLGRIVAVKMMLDSTTAAPEQLARFRLEAEAVAKINHPNVIQIYEIGERRGSPYLVLEYADAGSLDRAITGQPLPPRTAAELVRILAIAVGQLHRQGIVHCDLKPANILLAKAEGSAGLPLGENGTYIPKIGDFGLARHLETELSGRSGEVIGTVQYIAPEQVRGSTQQITPPTDIHALGVILYELLVGRPPFLGTNRLEIARQVCDRDPVAPRNLQPNIPRDLETITLKCLQKEPAKRYASGEELAEDLNRFQEGRPITARPVGPAERAFRWCRRNPWIAGLAATLTVAILAGFIAITAKMIEAREERNAKEQARQGEKTRADELAESLQRLEVTTHRMRIVAAGREVRDMNIPGANRILDECKPELRSFDWYYLKQLCRGSRITVSTDQRSSERVAISQDGKLLAVAGSMLISQTKSANELEQTICIVDAQSGTVLRRIPGGDGKMHWPTGMAFSSDGKRLAVAQADKTLVIRNVVTGELIWSVKDDRGFFDIAALGNGEFMTAGERWIDSNIPSEKTRILPEFKVWNFATGRLLRSIDGPQIKSINYGTLSRDGLHFACWSSYPHDLNNGNAVPVIVCNTRTGKLEHSFAEHISQIRTVSLSDDGQQIAVADRHAIRVNSVIDGKLLATFPVLSGNVYSIAFGAKGQTLAIAGEDRAIRLWDIASGRQTGIYRGHEDAVSQVRFSSDGKGMISTGHDGTVRAWNPTPPGIALRSVSSGKIHAVAGSSRGPWFATSQPTSGTTGTIRVFDASEPEKHFTIPGSATSLALDPDGDILAAATAATGKLLNAGKCGTWILDPSTGKERRFIPALVGPLHFSQDSRSVFGIRARPDVRNTMFADVSLHLNEIAACDPETGKEQSVLSGHTRTIRAICLSSDGKTLVSGDDEEVITWDVESRLIVGRFSTTHRFRLESLARRGDGKQLATSGDIDRTIIVRDPPTGRKLYSLKLNANATSLAFSPDSRLLVGGCDDGSVHIWDAPTGQLLLTIKDLRDPVRSLAFGGNGQWLVAGTGGSGPTGEAIIWNARTMPGPNVPNQK